MKTKIIPWLVALFLLVSLPLPAKKNLVKTIEANQKYINKGKTFNHRVNRLGEVLVDSIEARLASLNAGDWKRFRKEGARLNLLVLFNRLGKESKFNLEDFNDPLRRNFYHRLGNAMGMAIEGRTKLLEKVRLLHFDVDKLTAMIEKTGGSVIDRDQREHLGFVKAEEAVYELFLSVEKKQGILSVGGKIVIIETGDDMAFSGNYQLKARQFIDEYAGKDKPGAQAQAAAAFDKIRPPADTPAGELTISKIYYRAPGSGTNRVISADTVVESGGQIWFELTLPEGGGYLLSVLTDGHGRVYNLFPGTRNALLNGDYRVPFNLGTPYTDVQRMVAENNAAAGLSYNKVLLGGYTFDDEGGTESFRFYYLDKRSRELENLLKDAHPIGRDIAKMKGVLQGVSGFRMNQRISGPAFYHTKLELKFRHK